MIVFIKSIFKFSAISVLVLFALGVLGIVMQSEQTVDSPSRQSEGAPKLDSVSARGSIDPISSLSLNNIEGDLWDWAEGRWDDVRVFREGDNHVVALIEIRPEANSTAQSGYCRVLGESIRKYLDRGQTWEAELIQNGRTVRGCP